MSSTTKQTPASKQGTGTTRTRKPRVRKPSATDPHTGTARERITEVPADEVTTESVQPTEVRHIVTEAVAAALSTIAGAVLSTDKQIVKLQLTVAATLRDARDRFFCSATDGEPIKLVFNVGTKQERELGFYEWAMEACKLNRSSLGNYVDAGEVLRDHPEAAEKLGSIQAAVLVKRAERRKPRAVPGILSALKPGATASEVEAVITKKAPKPAPKHDADADTKRTTALEGKLRDHVEPCLAMLGAGKLSDAQFEAFVSFGEACISWATDPSIGKGSALTATAVGNIAASWRERTKPARRSTKQ